MSRARYREAASSAGVRFDAAGLRLLAGAELVKGFKPPGGGAEKCFCGECGAHLFSRSPDGGWVSVRMSAFDRDPGVRPSYRQFVAYAASWEPIPDDGLPRFPESRPR